MTEKERCKLCGLVHKGNIRDCNTMTILTLKNMLQDMRERGAHLRHTHHCDCMSFVDGVRGAPCVFCYSATQRWDNFITQTTDDFSVVINYLEKINPRV